MLNELTICVQLSFILTAHLAASEGHLPCLKFIVCAGASIDHTLNARNDQVIISQYFTLRPRPH